MLRFGALGCMCHYLRCERGQKLESNVGKSLTEMRKNKSQRARSRRHWALIDWDMALLES